MNVQAEVVAVELWFLVTSWELDHWAEEEEALAICFT
jgi:hypothetical protein